MVKRVDEPRWVCWDGAEFPTEQEAKEHEMLLWLAERPWMKELTSIARLHAPEIFRWMLSDRGISVAKLEVHRHD